MGDSRNIETMHKNIRTLVIGLLVMLACINIVNAGQELLQGTTSDYGVVPTVYSNDNAVTCADAGCEGTRTLLIEQDGAYDGTYCIDATHCIMIVANMVMGADRRTALTGRRILMWSVSS
jgi:hypothetical protein